MVVPASQLELLRALEISLRLIEIEHERDISAGVPERKVACCFDQRHSTPGLSGTTST